MTSHAGIYIHIPFCRRKCTYCNFNTTDFAADLAARYVESVTREIAYWGGRCERVSVDSIYFGGGTPSMLEAEEIALLIDACRRSFDVLRETEITIEINPESLHRKKLEGWLASSVSRVSVGVQSFIDGELVQLSRTHSSSQARRTIDVLREAGFRNVSLDLIAGLPDQSLIDWEFNLQEAVKIKPEHLSLYLLEVKEGTQLFGQIRRGLRAAPDDDLAAEMYRLIREATAAAGYEHYEISNFALAAGLNGLPGPFRSRHNLKYWTDAPYYGVGCGAHSYDGRSRWVNVLKTETYVENVMAKGSAIADRRVLTEEERLGDALFMALRLTEGISLEKIRESYGVDVVDHYRDGISRLLEAGLIEIEGDRMRLTEKGLPLSNEVFMVFV